MCLQEHPGTDMYEEHGGVQGSQAMQVHMTVRVDEESSTERMPFGTDGEGPSLPICTVKG